MHFVGNGALFPFPSESEELYIVYNCSLERTVLHEYSYIYFCFNLKCLCRVPYSNKADSRNKSLSSLRASDDYPFCVLFYFSCLFLISKFLSLLSFGFAHNFQNEIDIPKQLRREGRKVYVQ